MRPFPPVFAGVRNAGLSTRFEGWVDLLGVLLGQPRERYGLHEGLVVRTLFAQSGVDIRP